MKRALILLNISVFLWGFTGILARAIQLNEGVLVWYRMLLAGISWVVIGTITKKVILLSRKEFARLAGVGLLLTLHWLCFYGSIKYSNISVGMSCLPIIAVYSSVLEPLMLKQKFIWYEMLLAIMALLGMFFIFRFNEVYRTGIVLGLCSSLFASVFTILNKRMVVRHNSETVSTYEIGTGFIWLTLLMPLYLWLFPTSRLLPEGHEWLLLILFSVMCTVIPFNLATKALSKVSAFTATLLLNMEPIYGILLAFVFYREQSELNSGFFIGAALIFGSVILYMLLRLRHRIKGWIPWLPVE